MIPKKMRAAFVVKPDQIEVRETDVPRTGPEDVLIKVAYSGICGTDLAIVHGIYSSEYLPLIPGHEFAGHVAGWGEKVEGFKEGRFVTADVNMGCGECFYCRKNQILNCPEMKQLGIHTHGSFAQYVAVPAKYVRTLPDTVDTAAAALLEPVSCVVRAARRGEITFARSVAVIGAGPAGLLHLQMARICGAAPIIAIGKHEQRLKIARDMGADHVVLHGPDESDRVRELTGGRGADVVIESVGGVETYEKAFNLVRPGGGIIAFGLPEAGKTARYEPFLMVLRETSMVGTVAGMGEDVYDAVRLVENNRFNLEPFTSTRLPLERISEGFEMAEKDKSVLKVLIDLQNN